MWHDKFLLALKAALSESDKSRLSILEAGGGSRTFIEADRPADWTTIDISPEQLAKNRYAKEKILGDLQSYDYGDRRFDLIVCWNVLEHLEAPERAVDRLVAALAPGGLILVRGPIPRSMKGIVTRLTPHRLHVLFYRWILNSPTAGQPGCAPFRAYLAPAAGPAELRRSLMAAHLEIVASDCFSTDHTARFQAKAPPLFALYQLAARMTRMLSHGRLGGEDSDFYIMARRPRLPGPEDRAGRTGEPAEPQCLARGA